MVSSDTSYYKIARTFDDFAYIVSWILLVHVWENFNIYVDTVHIKFED